MFVVALYILDIYVMNVRTNIWILVMMMSTNTVYQSLFVESHDES